MNSAKLVCDCKLGWLPEWLSAASFVSSVSGTCLEPSSLRGRRIYDLDRSDFACDAGEGGTAALLLKIARFGYAQALFFDRYTMAVTDLHDSSVYHSVRTANVPHVLLVPYSELNIVSIASAIEVRTCCCVS